MVTRAPEATRERILDAAARTVEEHGVASATTSRIAAAAGVSEGTLYNHFADKPQLLTAVVLERLPSIRDAFETARADVQVRPLEDTLASVLVALVTFYERAQPIVAGISSDPRLLKLCRTRFLETGEGPQKAHEKLAALLEDERQRGRLRADAAPAVLASMLIGACTEYASMNRLTGIAPAGLGREEFASAVAKSLAPLLKEPGRQI